MPQLKLDNDDLDLEELENEPYDPDESRVRYTGEMPPPGTILPGYASKMWLTYTTEKPDGSGGDPMLKVLFIADDTAGEFEGCPIFDNITLNAASKWRWFPFLSTIGLTISDVKTKLFVEPDDDNVGAPIQRIAKWTPGEDHDEAYYRVITKRHKYNGEWQLDVDEYLPYEDEEEANPPARSSRSGKPARSSGNGSSRSSGSARGSRRASKPADDGGDAGDEEGEEAATPARGGRRSSSRAASATKPAGRGRGRRGSDGSDDEPPF